VRWWMEEDWKHTSDDDEHLSNIKKANALSEQQQLMIFYIAAKTRIEPESWGNVAGTFD
jgi:hypothetical protein